MLDLADNQVMEKPTRGRPPKDLDPLREVLSKLPRKGRGLVRAPATRVAATLGWHRETVDAGLQRLVNLGEIRIVQRGRGKRGALVMFLDEAGKPSRLPVWEMVA